MNNRKISKILVTIIPFLLFFINNQLHPEETDDLAGVSIQKQCRILLKEGQQLMAEGRYDSAKIIIDSILICDPVNADAYYSRAVVNMKLGDTLTAVKSFTDGVERAPFSSRLKIGLARLLLLSEKSDDALQLIESVLIIKPHESEAIYLKGLVYLARADTSAAIEALQNALDNALSR